MTDINKCPYITLHQSLIANADRHRANAEHYMMEGNFHHAIGSYDKMLRNLKRAYYVANLEPWK